MTKIITLITLALLTVWCCEAQVRSGAYRAMLKTLLSHSVPEMTVKHAVDSSLRDRAVFLDAREPKEYAVSHIEGSTLVGFDHFDLQKVPSMPKDTPIVVYCSVGYRSEKVAEKLIKAGYTNVSNLYGGIFEWVNESQPVQDDKGETQRVHAYDRAWGVWLRKGKKVY
jgi:rhodanese-related sulfurtransferase